MSQAMFGALMHELGPGHVLGFFFVLARVSPLFVIAPLFSSTMLPPQVRTIVAVALAIGMTPLAMHGVTVPSDPIVVALMFVSNSLVGLAFAIAVGAVIAAVTSAGAFIDVIAGFSYGQLINPMDGTQAGVLSNLYTLVGLALFMGIGGDAWMLRGIAHTFTIVPLIGAPAISSLASGVDSAGAGVMLGALELAAPALLALFITDVAFGMVSRVVPQLNVFAVGFPLKLGVALLVVAAALPFLGDFVSNQIASAVTTALQSL